MILTNFVGRILNLWQTVEPQQRKRSGDEQKHSRQSGKPSREFGLLGFEDQARTQVFVYFAQVGFALCFEILGVCLLGDALKRTSSKKLASAYRADRLPPFK